jgi:hypothetical protein
MLFQFPCRRRHAGFIDEYEPSRIKLRLSPLQRPSGGGHVRAILLGCPQTFFKGQLQMMQKPGDRRLPDRDLPLRQSVLKFGQRDVRLPRHQLPHQILVRRQREILVTAELGRTDAARFSIAPTTRLR